jgi:DUF4097 and DUF4098 domain-containing protein YvlB
MRRRHSIIAPMILILIGGVFLIRNFFPEIHVGDLIASYWPYVLILWGAIRLGEIVVWAMQNKPLPRNGVTGGEWVLVVFLCIFGTAFHAAHHRDFWFANSRAFRSFWTSWGQRFDFPVSPVEKPCGPAPRIVIDNQNGYAIVTGADVRTVKVTAHKSIRAFRKEDADRASNNTPIEVTAANNDVNIRTNQDRITEDMEMATDLDVTVPTGATIIARGSHGDVTVTNVTGSVDVKSDSAAVHLQSIGGDVRVDLGDSQSIRASAIKGAVELKGYGRDLQLQDVSGTVTVNGTYTGEVDFRHIEKPLHYIGSTTITFNVEQIPGEINYRPGQLMGENIVGPIHLEARSTSVRLIGFTRQLEAKLTGAAGDLDLLPGGATLPSMEVRTETGNIDLKLPSAARFDLKVMTERGRAENGYGPPLRVEDDGRIATITGGQGGPQLRLTTERGQVSVRKSTDEGGSDTGRIPAPPPPPARPSRQI